MGDLYDCLRTRLQMAPIVALRWIYGPKDLPASRLPNFMEKRRRALGLKHRIGFSALRSVTSPSNFIDEAALEGSNLYLRDGHIVETTQ